jgi:hypothetical protein
MKRSYKKPRAKKVRLPKPVAPPKPERQKSGDLKKIYKDLISTDIAQRVDALSRAMAWYDKVQACIAYKQNGKLTISQLRAKRNAESQRAAGIKSTNVIYKESAFMGAIKDYEIMCRSYKIVKLAPVVRKFKSSKSALVMHKKHMHKKHGKFLDIINKALGVKIGVDKLTSLYRISSDGNITLDRIFVKDLQRVTRKRGLLSGIIPLLPIVSESLSRYVEVDNNGHKTGRVNVDYKVRYVAVLNLIHSLNMYGQEEDAVRSIVRRKHKTT